MSYSVIKVDEAYRALMQATTVEEVLGIRSKAEACRVFVKQAGQSLEMQNRCAEIKLKAEKKAGELLAAMELHNGDPRLHDATRLSDLGVSKHQSSRWQKIASLDDEVFAELVQDCQRKKVELTQALVLKKAGAHVSNNSGEDEWYTPSQFIEAARRVLEVIDLDPASSESANEVVKATRFFSEDDNGLSQEWTGRVWMNPPYGQPVISHFAEKMAASVESGAVTESITLVNNATETKWCQRLLGASAALCFPNGRIRYWYPERDSKTPLQGQVFIYCGANTGRFITTFSEFGYCK